MPSQDLRSIDLLSSLIAFDTTSRNSNLEAIDFIRDHLDQLGIASTLVFNEEGTKANLFATIGPQDRGGIMLSGHTDVVPVDGQDWTMAPFRLTERDGRFHGRGTADMKGFIAVSLSFARDFRDAGLALPVHFAFSYDEELGCIGIGRLIDHLNAAPVRPVACIVGEPTGMLVASGHKGKLAMRCHVRGHACHSSLAPTGVNAVEYAAEVVTYLRRMGRRIAAEGPFDPSYDIPHTTVHTGRIDGGIALNIVPEDCMFEFEFRNLPSHPAEPLLEEVQRFVTETLEPEIAAKRRGGGFSWQRLSFNPGLDTPDDHPLVTAVKGLAGRNDHGRVAFGTEGGLFQRNAGIPAVVCGPGHIAQAHKPDEYIEASEIARAERFMEKLIADLRDGRGIADAACAF